MKYNKKELLRALRTTLAEYRRETHSMKKTACALCVLYLQDGYNCDDCPMDVFRRINQNEYPCMNRKCNPLDCRDDKEFFHKYDYKKRLKRVIAFYKAVIKKVVNMTTKELNAEGAFKFMKDIDKEIARAYKLKKN